MFLFTKLHDFGSAHPIIARITMGLADLVRFTHLAKEKQQQIIDLSYDLAKDLIEAEKNGSLVVNEMQAIENRWFQRNDDSRYATFSTFESLSSINEVRNCLKYSKAALRITVTIMGIFIEKDINQEQWKNYKNGRFDKIREDLNKKQLKDPSLLKTIEEYSDWLEYISFLRDEDEHPKGFKDFIENYRVVLEEKGYILVRPNFKDGSPLYETIESLQKHLFLFCECICVRSLHECIHDLYEIVEIPEAERNKSCPKRFKIELYQ